MEWRDDANLKTLIAFCLFVSSGREMLARCCGGELIMEEDGGGGVRGMGDGVCRLLCPHKPPDMYRA